MELELTVSKCAFGGDGIAKVDGKTCFVEGALPGERVLARVTQDKKNFLRAKTLKVLEASPDRVEPPCPYVSRCGGCQYQHVRYEAELKLKESQVQEALERIASEAVFKPIRHAAADYGYRSSVTLHPAPSTRKQPAALGFIGRDNVSVVPIDNCLLVDPKLSGVFRMKIHPKKTARRISFRLSEEGKVVSDLEEVFYRVRVGGTSVLAGSKGFFQNNLAVTTLLADQVAEWVKKIRPKILFDLYAGAGTFGLLSAGEVERVVSVEENPAGIEAMRMNREEKNLSNVEIVKGRVERVFPDLWDREKNEGRKVLVLLDPPRQGIDRSLAEFLSAASGVTAIAYVSCDIATLARDLGILLSKKRFRVREIVPFDMFPRTRHIEAAALLVSV